MCSIAIFMGLKYSTNVVATTVKKNIHVYSLAFEYVKKLDIGTQIMRYLGSIEPSRANIVLTSRNWVFLEFPVNTALSCFTN